MKYVLSVALWLKPQNFFINADGVVLSQECRTFVERHFSSFTFLVCIVFGERQLICHSVLIHHKFQGKGRNIRHETSQYSVSSDQYINQVSSYFRHFVTTSFFLVHICLKFKTLKNSLMFELYEISNDICQTLIEIFRR